MKRILSIAFIGFTLSSCSMLQNNPTNDHAAVCNELKRQIIYNGATIGEPRSPAPANQPLATQQRAQLDKANASYNQMGC